jgi:2-methylisocitrate lyase-like PEP mutase family enzyme
LRAFGARFKGVPLLANMVEGGRTPVLPPAEREEIGYKIAIFPALGFLAAGAALEAVYAALRRSGSSKGAGVPLYDFQAFSELMGFGAVAEFERRYR